MHKVSWHSLTKTEKFLVGNVPGAGSTEWFTNWLLNEYFAFKFSNFAFGPHDWAYIRGGGVRDKVKSDLQMLFYLWVDALEQETILKGLLLFFIVAPLAFLTVLTLGFIFFDFVPYRSKQDAMWEVKKYRAKKRYENR